MFKERLQAKVDEFIIRYIQLGKNHGLKPEGKPYLRQFIDDYKRGIPLVFSRYIHMLDGFDYESNISGLDNLEDIKNQPMLIVANHSNEGPLRGGHGQRLVISYYINRATQKEIRWLHGGDKTTPQDLVRKRLAQRSNTILVRDDDPETSRTLIIQAFRNKDIMGINPEGDGSKTLLRGKPEAGRMLWLSTINNYSIVCVATYFEKDTFFLNIAPPLDNEIIKNAAKQSSHRNTAFQQIVDCAMHTIAQHLPENRRGYYGESQKPIT